MATITVLEEGVIDHARRLGAELFEPALSKIKDRHPCVGDVRGLGAMGVLDLVADPSTRVPLAPSGGGSAAMSALTQELKADGMLPLVSSKRLYVMPPCNIHEDDAHLGLESIDRALEVADTYVG